VITFFQYAQTSGLMLLCFVNTILQFLKKIIFQGSAAIRFRCGEICHKSSLKIVCWP